MTTYPQSPLMGQMMSQPLRSPASSSSPHAITAASEIVSRRVDRATLHRYTYRECERARAAGQCAAGRWACDGRTGRHPGLERLPPPGAVLRGVRLGRGAAHHQSAPASGADRLHRQPCRRPVPVLRPDLPAAGRGDRAALQDGEGLRADERPRPHAGRRRDRRTCCATKTCWPPAATTTTWPLFDENSAASLCYTSGTTGNPKGVLYSHRSTVLHAYASALPNA
jgi:hypothetical protein